MGEERDNSPYLSPSKVLMSNEESPQTFVSAAHGIQPNLSNSLSPSIGIPKWKMEQTVNECPICRSQFGFFKRKHHCRACGGVFCDSCTTFRASLTELGLEEQVRICAVCVTNVHIPAPPLQNGIAEELSSLDGSARFKQSMNGSATDKEIKEWLSMINNSNQQQKFYPLYVASREVI